MAGYEGTETRSGKMIFEPILEEGVFRFDCSADDRNAAFPSISFENPEVRDTPLVNVNNIPTYIPSFECVLGQQILTIEFPPNTSFYGTGEVSGQLERTGKRIDLRKEANVKLISSSPYPVITFGPFASPVDVLASFSRAVDFKIIPGYLLVDYLAIIWKLVLIYLANDIKSFDVIGVFQFLRCCVTETREDCNLTSGWLLQCRYRTVFMPPKWSLGYHQCRWSYHSDARVREERFPDPKTLAEDLHQHGFKAIWMLDPGIKKEEGYFVYDSGSKRDIWIQTADGKPFVGDVWPGPCVFPDFTQSSARSWWANLVKDFITNGVDGIWNDMNEPAVFKVYGTLMARSTYEGMKLANEQKRPFVLTRAGFVGSQRYAATWTGDNLSTWEHLHMSISMVVQLCEEVCRLALRRRYRFLPHIYTLFYMAHTRGIPVATPTFFADPKDLELRTHENSFLLGPLLVYASTGRDQELYQMQHKLPKGVWFSFDFEDSHPDLPALYLQGGSIIPVAPPYQHVGEANPTDDLSLLVALNENGKAEGMLFEDDGDGYEYTKGGYLLTTYVAEKQSSVVTVKVLKTEGSWKRPNRRLHVQLLLGKGAKIDAWGVDGEMLQIPMPSESEVSDLMLASEKQLKTRIGTQWLHSRVDVNGYEEYSSVEFRSAGCSEEYSVLGRDLEQAGEVESLQLEGDIGGGLVLERRIYISKDNPRIFRIDSGIVARKVGAGSGGFSRLVCLRVHPMFNLLHPTESYVSFTAVDGSKHEVWPESGEWVLEGDLRPNGEWKLVDKCVGLALVNRFNISQVYKCLIHWGTGTVNLELWSEERPVSKESPLRISHEYEVTGIP
ncbi:UNVERIFIED_CONTAM: Alpha-glucosidase 2 [Sesamum radiatum]|uniref:Alpha-glucosidase 2 n=1 Tax=Sesamum radiatum TaxID=300843 RepID=A0AAW2JT85_SESRA